MSNFDEYGSEDSSDDNDAERSCENERKHNSGYTESESLSNSNRNGLSSISFNTISNSIYMRNKNFDYSSESKLRQSFFLRNHENLKKLSGSVYWADKIMDHKIIAQALFPEKSFFQTKFNFISSLTKIRITVDKTSYKLNGWQSVRDKNFVTCQHGVFINAGCVVLKMCWASLIPDSNNYQYLAALVKLNNLDNAHSYKILIYRFTVIMGTKSMETPELEMILTHDWGKISDIVWSPQPLPVVTRSVPLIGHLSVACKDGFVRILPIALKEIKSEFVTVTMNHLILCLGLADSKGMYPTCIDWSKQNPNYIAVGYSLGNIAIYDLDAGFFIDLATVTYNRIQISPTYLHQVLQTRIISLQISPNKWYRIAVASKDQHAIIVDMLATWNPSIVLDKVNISATSVIWPDPGDIITVVGGSKKTTDIVFYGAHNSIFGYTNLSIEGLSTVSYNVALNVMVMGTNNGKLNITSVDGSDINKLLLDDYINNESLSKSGLTPKLYHKYSLKQIEESKTNDDCMVMSESVKCEIIPDAANTSHCKCDLAPYCVHGLWNQYSLSVSKDEDITQINLELQESVKITGYCRRQ